MDGCFADLFLHAYDADFLQWLLQNNDRKLAPTFNSSFRYIDDVLSLNHSRFDDYLHHIYPNEFEVKDNTNNKCLSIEINGRSFIPVSFLLYNALCFIVNYRV